MTAATIALLGACGEPPPIDTDGDGTAASTAETAETAETEETTLGDGETLLTDATGMSTGSSSTADDSVSTTMVTGDTTDDTTGDTGTTEAPETDATTETPDTETSDTDPSETTTDGELGDCVDAAGEIDWACCEAQNWMPFPQCTPWGPPAPPAMPRRTELC